MGILALLKNLLTWLPSEMKNPKWVFVIILLILSMLYVNQWDFVYKLSSQRVTLKMAVVTPLELDLLEELCISESFSLRSLVVDRSSVCTPEVISFFKGRGAEH